MALPFNIEGKLIFPLKTEEQLSELRKIVRNCLNKEGVMRFIETPKGFEFRGGMFSAVPRGTTFYPVSRTEIFIQNTLQNSILEYHLDLSAMFLFMGLPIMMGAILFGASFFGLVFQSILDALPVFFLFVVLPCANFWYVNQRCRIFFKKISLLICDTAENKI